ncbi:DUF4230 domain-containing protein [Bifidobacterium moukalabense]|uniref:DUF4230 domain-containing protein n=1 Tax=Bifidobacterium moukalabense TaxID=1333651 RepID=UPI0010F59891|nr:DUF4230 domain-containing protein [Bifidobacterium moukalabense]
MKVVKQAVVILGTLALCLGLASCGESKSKAEPTFSNATAVAQLSTVKCYYHNIAKLDHSGSWFFNQGYKKMWIEYSGIVEYGIDATQVDIHKTAGKDEVVITMPEAEVLGLPDVDEKSFSKPLEETGFATSVTAEEKAEMFDRAQQDMLEQAKKDTTLIAQAQARAKTLLEQYVRNTIGEGNENWTVTFEETK